LTDFFTNWTIFRGVMLGPEGYFRGSFSPVARSLTFVPPTSITRTFGDFGLGVAFITAPLILRNSRGNWRFSEENSQSWF
jgi:hypothetical protein